MNDESIIIKASFQKCSTDDRKLFSSSKCIMPISIGVGQKVHEGSKFAATIKLISAYFKECDILLDDSIQRYTKQIGIPDASLEALREIAIKEGDEWLERNRSTCEQLSIPCKIIRWDYWRTHADYQLYYDQINNLYQTDDIYRQVIDDNIITFIERHTAYMNIREYNVQQAFDNCLAYLKEECSVMCLWASEKYDFEVYPSGRNTAMEATHERLIKPNNPNMLKSVGIRFKKY